MDHSDHISDSSQSLSLTTKLALGGAIIAAGVVFAPYVAPMLGVGDLNTAESALEITHYFTEGDGLAKVASKTISLIPYIGENLAKDGLTNIVATGAIGIGGVSLGHLISGYHQGDGTDWGRIIMWSALATSALIALPSILTGITNGVIYTLFELGEHGIIDPFTQGKPIAEAMIQTVGVAPYIEAQDFGYTGLAVTLPHLLTCGFSMVPLALGFGTHKALKDRAEEKDYIALDTKGKPLPDHDRNHAMTREEIALTDSYNNASPAQRVILKKQILDRGYDPDFHADGTVHLYKHEAHASQPVMGR